MDRVAPRGRGDASGGHSYEYNGVYNQGDGALSNHHKRASHFRAHHRMLLTHDADEDGQGITGCVNSLMANGNNCPQPWDNHEDKGMNMMLADGHAEWAKKEAGTYVDRRVDPPREVESPNASIDRVWLRSQYPWLDRR